MLQGRYFDLIFFPRQIYGNVVGYWDVRGRRGVLVADVELFQEFNAKNEFSGRAVPGYHFTQ